MGISLTEVLPDAVVGEELANFNDAKHLEKRVLGVRPEVGRHFESSLGMMKAR